MTPGRPSKEERERWAEMLGDERRTARRWRGRLGLLIVAVVVIGVPWSFARSQGYIGCQGPAEMKAFWAKEPGASSDGERDKAIRRDLRCVEIVGMTRTQVQAQLGDWTPVKQYPIAASKVKGLLLVWSQSANTDGIAVEFTGPHGHAVRATKYVP